MCLLGSKVKEIWWHLLFVAVSPALIWLSYLWDKTTRPLKKRLLKLIQKRLEGDSPKGLAALPADAGTPGKKPKQDPPSAKKDEGEKELTDEQKAALKAAGLEF